MRVRQQAARTAPRAQVPYPREPDDDDTPSPHGHRWKLAGAIAGLAFWAVVLWLIFR